MKKIILLVFSGLISLTTHSQKSISSKLGDVSKEELEMMAYENDTIAGALILKEHGNYYLNKKRNYRKTTDYYFKVKILKKKGVDESIVKIRYYDEEKIHDIKGITYNLLESGKVQKKHLLEKDVYYKDLGNKWKEAVFTMPDIKEGSVIEYVYSVTSPYSAIDDWKFQSDIPKLKSDFTASILGNWQYNVRILGFLKLKRNDQKIQHDCIDVPGLSSGACVNLSYGMDTIPAFEEEDYMLSPDNYKAKLSFELALYKSPRGR
ncbi:DUF3857 domain-containing protein [Tenacibaculum sp. MAR_2009_124]|uniref:DUF3857 domain-containing protein n=1 Tax=Tenacibaculum sp. MAR_2009_124 TaxID=1250059 RepID=UPI000B84FF1B|nr:DUF3857 domain-containing protein [Tenacibaculum sp. MAR_2009_124]